MSRYIKDEDLSKLMYHEAFEVDSDMQKWDSGCWIRYKVFENCLEQTPTADVKPVVRGEWIDEEYDIGECYATCSVCGEISQGKTEDNGFGYNYSFSNYCPNCGARMVEE